MGVACCKNAHCFQMDSQTCATFSGKFRHEPKDSWLTFLAKWQKGGVAVGAACDKKAHDF